MKMENEQQAETSTAPVRVQRVVRARVAPADALCNRRACKAPGANWWNPHTRAWYCRPCAIAINHALQGPLFCVRVPRDVAP
jgi:hypothetical protein